MNAVAGAVRAGTQESSIGACPLNEAVVVTSVDLDHRHVFRLQELGVGVGSRVRVVQKSAFGGRVVAHGRERLALDGQTALHVRVAVPTAAYDRCGVAAPADDTDDKRADQADGGGKANGAAANQLMRCLAASAWRQSR